MNIMDGGVMLAHARRILDGEVPHRDFISPIPAGSSYFHLLDYALPLPLVLASKVVATAEFLAAGVCLGLFVMQKRLRQLTFVEGLAVFAGVLIGIHQYPIIPMYTIDGLMFAAAGLLLIGRAIRDRRPGLRLAGFACLGIAMTMKQSFWFLPLMAFAWVLSGERTSIRRAAATASTSLAAVAAAPVLYTAYIASAGGFRPMLDEVTGTRPTYGLGLLAEFTGPGHRAGLLPSFVAITLLVSASARRGRLPVLAGLPTETARQIDVGCRCAASILVLHLTVAQQFRFNGEWGAQLFWCVLAVTIVRTVAERRIDAIGAIVAGLGWVVSLSWGAPTPELAGGASVVYLAQAIWRDTQLPTAATKSRWFVPAAAIIAAAVVAYDFAHARARADYGVARASETVHLGGPLRGVAMDPTTSSYLQNVERCVSRYPARWTGVLPEGALAYALYDLRNPFPVDWFWADTYRGARGRQRILGAASTADGRGDYLILFQDGPFGGAKDPGEVAPFISDPTLASQIATRLAHARRLTCGDFVAFYDPAS